MDRYKFRAECGIDIINFFKSIPEESYDMVSIHYLDGDSIIPDREVVFTSTSSLASLIQSAKHVDNGHVIAQTMRPETKYTGDRNYNI